MVSVIVKQLWADVIEPLDGEDKRFLFDKLGHDLDFSVEARTVAVVEMQVEASKAGVKHGGGRPYWLKLPTSINEKASKAGAYRLEGDFVYTLSDTPDGALVVAGLKSYVKGETEYVVGRVKKGETFFWEGCDVSINNFDPIDARPMRWGEAELLLKSLL